MFPNLTPARMWWPLLWSLVVQWFVLAKDEERDALLYPTKHGYKSDS